MFNSFVVSFLQVGLCHVSELSDEHIDNIETKYKAGEVVRAKVLKVIAIVLLRIWSYRYFNHFS